MAAPWQGLPVRLERAPHRGAAFALSNASKRAEHGGPTGDDKIDLAVDELGRDFGEALAASFRPAVFDRHGAALDPAEIAHALHESGNPARSGPHARPCRGSRWSAAYAAAAHVPQAARLPLHRRVVR